MGGRQNPNFFDSGAVVELRVAEGLWHVFEWYPDLPEAAASVREIASFLGKFVS